MPTTARTPRNVGNTSCSIKGANSIRDIGNSRDFSNSKDNGGNKGVSIIAAEAAGSLWDTINSSVAAAIGIPAIAAFQATLPTRRTQKL